ncbi:MAG: hypothetical protein IT581_05905 [Verrucomicrobiales bacterium]|nr:hypothetical protein [Verrucomicrobiales bacterium]
MKSRTLPFRPWLPMFSLPLVVSLGLVTSGRSVLAEAKDDQPPRTLALVVETQDTDKDKTKTVEVEKEVREAVAEASNDVREATETVRDIVSNALKEAGRAFSDVAQVGRSVALSFRRGGAPWALVLPGDRLNADQAEQMTEDLAVMTKILRKAARPGDGDPGDWRGGPALAGLMPGGLGPDAFYLDGFGALFLISVDFPLVGPKEETGQREEPVTDETWEQTRRELRDGGDPFGKGFRVNNRPGEAAAVYRPDRVNALRESLIDALKHATHVGAVPPDETIAVAVFCPPARNASSAATYRHRTRSPGSQDDEVVWQSGPGPGPDSARLPGSVMGLRVRKGDIDAFAKGKMDRETFVKKVQISTR